MNGAALCCRLICMCCINCPWKYWDVSNDNVESHRTQQSHRTQAPPLVSVPPTSQRTNLSENGHLPFAPEKSPISSPPVVQLDIDLISLEHLNQLTVKELKLLLTINRVDFRGCIDKSELLEKVFRLWNDHNQHKDIPEDTPSDQLCKICMDAPPDCVLLECGHIATCVDCGKRLAECPICRQYVARIVRTFKA